MRQCRIRGKLTLCYNYITIRYLLFYCEILHKVLVKRNLNLQTQYSWLDYVFHPSISIWKMRTWHIKYCYIFRKNSLVYKMIFKFYCLKGSNGRKSHVSGKNIANSGFYFMHWNKLTIWITNILLSVINKSH